MATTNVSSAATRVPEMDVRNYSDRRKRHVVNESSDGAVEVTRGQLLD